MSEQETITKKSSINVNKEDNVIKAAKNTVAITRRDESVDLSRRYFTLGLFASVFLFKKKLINPSYQISRTGKFTFKLSMFLYRILKFLLWSSKKK